MLKRHLKALEKLFSAEIDSALNKSKLPGLVQSKARVFDKLETEGYAEKITTQLGGRFPVSVTGWALTPAGHMAYCMNCGDDVE